MTADVLEDELTLIGPRRGQEVIRCHPVRLIIVGVAAVFPVHHQDEHDRETDGVQGPIERALLIGRFGIGSVDIVEGDVDIAVADEPGAQLIGFRLEPGGGGGARVDVAADLGDALGVHGGCVHAGDQQG